MRYTAKVSVSVLETELSPFIPTLMSNVSRAELPGPLMRENLFEVIEHGLVTKPVLITRHRHQKQFNSTHLIVLQRINALR